MGGVRGEERRLRERGQGSDLGGPGGPGHLAERGRRSSIMTRTRCAWISLLLLSGLPLWTVGAPGFPGAPRAPGALEDPLLGPTGAPRGPRSSRSLRAGFYVRRAARSADAAAASRCSELAPPWQENPGPVPEDPPGALLQLRVWGPGSGAPPGPVFPGAPLLGFVRRVYRCCERGQSCRGLRGVQGRRTAGKSHTEGGREGAPRGPEEQAQPRCPAERLAGSGRRRFRRFRLQSESRTE